MKRRTFLATTTAAATASLFPAIIVRGEDKQNLTLGQGGFKYRVVPDWYGQSVSQGVIIKNCHGIVQTKDEHLVFTTDHVKNNVVICDKGGKLAGKWTLDFPGCHGLTIQTEGEGKDQREVLYITDIRIGKVVKTTLDGEVLERWGWPEDSGKYDDAKQYRPSWTLHKPDGEFFILDGYGKDYIQHIDARGDQKGLFGGKEGGITHWGPHGGVYDNEGLLIAMSDQQYLMKLDDEGSEKFRVQLPGGNPRQVQRAGDHYFVAHLADNWPKDRASPGYVSILDKGFKVVANLDSKAPQYGDDGKLQKMSALGSVFTHPHDLCVARDGSVYVAQFLSGGSCPIKLERV
ncbi:MAG: hypothetical protein KTR15_07365 [Phycisphaeraceae bacterium]|nr:hypothetical protein [Phycisphaeraceae bacterium]